MNSCYGLLSGRLSLANVTLSGQQVLESFHFYTLYATGNFGEPIQKEGVLQLIR